MFTFLTYFLCFMQLHQNKATKIGNVYTFLKFSASTIILGLKQCHMFEYNKKTIFDDYHFD